jgi:enoyl-CoA hydratase/carnithine racemase
MTIQWTIEQGIGRLTLNQPPSNTMTMEFFRDLRSLMHQISTLRNLKAIVISGNGRHYSSGADISELLKHAGDRNMIGNYQAFHTLDQLEIPVISAIRGVCLGSAFELALFSHFRICAEDAVLGLPESSYNLMPGLGGIQRLAAIAGKARAMELILRGCTFSAAEALEMMLVDAVVPKSMVIPLSLEFANALPGKITKADRAVCIHKYLKPLHAIRESRNIC